MAANWRTLASLSEYRAAEISDPTDKNQMEVLGEIWETLASRLLKGNVASRKRNVIKLLKALAPAKSMHAIKMASAFLVLLQAAVEREAIKAHLRSDIA
jgi:hypothetical protein